MDGEKICIPLGWNVKTISWRNYTRFRIDMDTTHRKFAWDSSWDWNKRHRRVVRFERVKIEFWVYIFTVSVRFFCCFFLVYLTCQVLFPHLIRMVSALSVGIALQSFRYVKLGSKRNRWSAIAATHHQQQPQWLTMNSIHILPSVLPNLFLFVKFYLFRIFLVCVTNPSFIDFYEPNHNSQLE